MKDFIGMKNKGKFKDTDKDGVADFVDCKPKDPNRQGIIHDVKMKYLERKEQSMAKKAEMAEEEGVKRKKIEEYRERIRKSRPAPKKKPVNSFFSTQQPKQKVRYVTRKKKRKPAKRKVYRTTRCKPAPKKPQSINDFFRGLNV